MAMRPDGPAADGWRRLDPRMMAVHPLRQLVSLLPVLAIALFTGRNGGWQLWIAVAAPAIVVVAGVLRWMTTRYRVSDERVELRSGLFRRQYRSVSRDRVRTVDLTAGPAHRLFGLSAMEIGTGTAQAGAGAAARLSLDAVTAPEAERLRRSLLDRSATPEPAVAADLAGTSAASASGSVTDTITSANAGEVLATLDWRWLRYAPLSTSGLVAIAALTGAAFNLANEIGLTPRDIGAVRRVGEGLTGVSLTLAIVLIASTVLLVAVIGSILIYIEGWWGYRLTREPDGTLLVRRGLLTSRALSVQERRLRGTEVSEPLLLRAGRGARCTAVTTGLRAKAGSGAVLPSAPRHVAHRVAAAALRTEPEDATAAPLAGHPRSALTRRLVRAVAPAAALCAGAWALDGPAPVLWPAALVLLPLAGLLGIDRYRGLGNALTDGYLVMRRGSLDRRTVALCRNGVIGWTLRQSIFQRRTGLVTLHAITAAGAGQYPAVDVAFSHALGLVEQATPGLLPINPAAELAREARI